MDKDAFPVTAIGVTVYSRSQSSPIAVCLTDAAATELAARLNYSDMCGFESPPTVPASEWMNKPSVGA